MTSQQGARRVGPYTVIHSQPVYENPWVKVREDRVAQPRGEEKTFPVITMKPGVIVLPMGEDGEVQLVREFKYAIGQPTIEAVSGAIESGETPEQAGLREIGEGLGLIASEWVDMGILNPFTAIVNCPNHMFLARKLSEIRHRLPAEEVVEAVKVPLAEALRWVLDGTISHGATCVLVLKTHLFLEQASAR